ncbi:hypothetical protein FACS1894184_03570 [Clostridia bacterium]|nr:hypothetical protein FACS1894184_03570 [Clostridia bacterium]
MITRRVRTTVFEIEQLGIAKTLRNAIDDLGVLDEDTIVNISINALDNRNDEPVAYILMHIKSLENVLFDCNAKARYTKQAHNDAMDILNAIKKLVERIESVST